MLDLVLQEILELQEKAKFAAICCDNPADRMYHAEDQTWWRRIGNRWRASDPPPGWVRDSAGTVGGET